MRSEKIKRRQAVIPDVSIKTVTLHISADSLEFPAAFGAKVKAAGGKHSDIRGGSSHRFVELPFTERDLPGRR
jgi:hypothetical protein